MTTLFTLGLLLCNYNTERIFKEYVNKVKEINNVLGRLNCENLAITHACESSNAATDIFNKNTTKPQSLNVKFPDSEVSNRTQQRHVVETRNKNNDCRVPLVDRKGSNNDLPISSFVIESALVPV